MAFDAKFLRISNIQWIGVFISDVDRFSLPQHCLLPLTNEGEIHEFCLKLQYFSCSLLNIYVSSNGAQRRPLFFNLFCGSLFLDV